MVLAVPPVFRATSIPLEPWGGRALRGTAALAFRLPSKTHAGDALGLDNGARTVDAYWAASMIRSVAVSGRDSRAHSVAAGRAPGSHLPRLSVAPRRYLL